MSVIILVRSVQWLWIAWDWIGPGWIALGWNGPERAGFVRMGFRRFRFPGSGAHSFSFSQRYLSEGSGSLEETDPVPDFVFAPGSVDLFLQKEVVTKMGDIPSKCSVSCEIRDELIPLGVAGTRATSRFLHFA